MKWTFIGIVGKSKYYVTKEGHLARSRKYNTRLKFEELGYIENNWNIYTQLCELI